MGTKMTKQAHVLAAIINTIDGTIVSTNTEPKKATEYRKSVRDLNGSINGTKFMVIEFRRTAINLPYFFEKFQVECDKTKIQLRIWEFEAKVRNKKETLIQAKEELNLLIETNNEIIELFKDNARKLELVSDVLKEQINEAKETVSEIEYSIIICNSNIFKLEEKMNLATS